MAGGADRASPYTFDRVVRLALSAAVLAAVLGLLRYLSDVLLPFAAAVVLAYLLNPLVTLLERRTKRRGLAVALTIGGLAVVGLALVALLIPLTVGQISRFQRDLGKLGDDLTASMEVMAVPAEKTAPTEPSERTAQRVGGPTEPSERTGGAPSLRSKGGGPTEPSERTAPPPSPNQSAFGWHELKAGWLEYRRSAAQLPRSQRLARLRDRLRGTYLGDVLDNAVAYTRSEDFNRLLMDLARRAAIGGWTAFAFAANLVLGLTGLIVVLLYLVFLLIDYPQYARTWPALLPPRYRGSIVEFLEQFQTALRHYFRGQSVVALLVGTLFSIGFWLIGLPMAVPFGLFVGLLNMVPYLQAAAIVPAMLLAGLRALEGDSSFLASVAATLFVFAVVQVIQDVLITPRVIGRATGLRPVAVLLGVFIWGKLLGFLGLLLAIPLTCLAIAYYRRYVLLHAA